MLSPDIALNICSLLDDETLEELYVLGIIPSLSYLVRNPLFWHSRVETLTGLQVEFSSDVDWKQVYQILYRKLTLDETPRFWNIEDNVDALEIVDRIFIPNSDDLHLSAKHGSIKILRWLLDDKRVDPELMSMRGMCPLNAATEEGQYEAVKMLLADKRVDPNCMWHHNTALILACETKHPDRIDSYVKIVKLLLADHRVNPTRDMSKALWVDNLSGGDNVEIIDLLLEDGRADPTDNDSMVLRCAVRYNRLETLARLLQDERVDPNVHQGVMLRIAIQEEHLEIIKLLLSDSRLNLRADDDLDSIADGDPAVTIALKRGNEEVVKLLLADDRVVAWISDWNLDCYLDNISVNPTIAELVRDAIA